MTAPLGLYWWSPWRDARIARWELRRNSTAWLSMALRGGRPLQNFGDTLSRRIVAEVTGRRVRWASPGSAQLVAIGSVIEHVAAAGGRELMWGSGLRSERWADTRWARRNPERFLAVRGALTRDALGLDSSTPLGDPGLLVRTLYQRAHRPSGIAVIPHFLAFNSPAARRQIQAARSAGMRVVVPSAGFNTVCEEVARAELVLTSSLHGMVVADALGCPVQLIAFGPTAEPSFKYSDYLSVFRLTAEFVSFADVAHDRAALGRVLDRAVERSGTVSRRVDAVVENLARSARPLADLE